jgi:hypothetical protein
LYQNNIKNKINNNLINGLKQKLHQYIKWTEVKTKSNF